MKAGGFFWESWRLPLPKITHEWDGRRMGEIFGVQHSHCMDCSLFPAHFSLFPSLWGQEFALFKNYFYFTAGWKPPRCHLPISWHFVLLSVLSQTQFPEPGDPLPAPWSVFMNPFISSPVLWKKIGIIWLGGTFKATQSNPNEQGEGNWNWRTMEWFGLEGNLRIQLPWSYPGFGRIIESREGHGGNPGRGFGVDFPRAHPVRMFLLHARSESPGTSLINALDNI